MERQAVESHLESLHAMKAFWNYLAHDNVYVVFPIHFTLSVKITYKSLFTDGSESSTFIFGPHAQVRTCNNDTGECLMSNLMPQNTRLGTKVL